MFLSLHLKILKLIEKSSISFSKRSICSKSPFKTGKSFSEKHTRKKITTVKSTKGSNNSIFTKMEILLLKNVDSTFKIGISTFQEWGFYILKWEFHFLRMEILHIKIGNSIDILESKMNLPIYSQINCRKCRIY